MKSRPVPFNRIWENGGTTPTRNGRGQRELEIFLERTVPPEFRTSSPISMRSVTAITSYDDYSR